jgi:hypothetical protein
MPAEFSPPAQSLRRLAGRDVMNRRIGYEERVNDGSAFQHIVERFCDQLVLFLMISFGVVFALPKTRVNMNQLLFGFGLEGRSRRSAAKLVKRR